MARRLLGGVDAHPAFRCLSPESCGKGTEPCAQRGCHSHLRESVLELVLLTSTPTKIRQLMHHTSNSKEYVDGCVWELTSAKRILKHFPYGERVRATPPRPPSRAAVRTGPISRWRLYIGTHQTLVLPRGILAILGAWDIREGWTGGFKLAGLWTLLSLKGGRSERGGREGRGSTGPAGGLAAGSTPP